MPRKLCPPDERPARAIMASRNHFRACGLGLGIHTGDPSHRSREIFWMRRCSHPSLGPLPQVAGLKERALPQRR